MRRVRSKPATFAATICGLLFALMLFRIQSLDRFETDLMLERAWIAIELGALNNTDDTHFPKELRSAWRQTIFDSQMVYASRDDDERLCLITIGGGIASDVVACCSIESGSPKACSGWVVR
jgi:hypothetical protein